MAGRLATAATIGMRGTGGMSSAFYHRRRANDVSTPGGSPPAFDILNPLPPEGVRP
jgi:hypothetical protein